LVQRVDRARGRHVVLAVGLLAAAVEDVVRRQVHQPRAAAGEVADGADVRRPRSVGLPFADVDVVEGGAVEDDVGLDLFERAIERRGVRDVELGVRERARAVAQAAWRSEAS